MEFLVQMKVRKQKMFVRTMRSESGFAEMATLVWGIFDGPRSGVRRITIYE
jgi:hypothetical protein